MGIPARSNRFSFIPKRLSFGQSRPSGLVPKKAVLSVFGEERTATEGSALPEDELRQLPPQERILARLLGHRPTIADLEEYYFEDLNPTTLPIPQRKTAPGPAPVPTQPTSSGWASLFTLPVVLLGRGTMLFLLQCYRLFLGQSAQISLPEEMNKPLAEQEKGHLSDLMISTIAGILIAVIVVFPTLRFLGHEVYQTIAKSAVRRIGSKVTLEQSQDSSILLPLVTEQFLFPKGMETGATQESSSHARKTGRDE
ncbi:MAG: hypothetical protein Q4G68_02360 [Planctomycetia bacterium]|nr:hypothetical protein [Planctomycetia bacterium]